MSDILRSFKGILILGGMVCGLYPVSVWMIGQAVFKDSANGGLIHRSGKPVGARLIGQSFTQPKYFQGRPSTAGEKGYDAANSSGSNLGPTNKKLFDRLQADIERILKENPNLTRGQIPTEWVTASGSGLDPDISVESARVQVERIAIARGKSPEAVRALLETHIHGREWGLFGEPKVNVLELNLALDEQFQ